MLRNEDYRRAAFIMLLQSNENPQVIEATHQ